MFTKSAKYYYDYQAILEPALYDGRKSTSMKGSAKYAGEVMPGGKQHTYAMREHERWPNKIKTRGRKKTDGNPNILGQPNQHHGSDIEFIQNARNKRDVWRVTTNNSTDAHFATFPEKLIKPCIEAGCPEGGVVLDPFVGSGTTFITSRKLGRNAVGIELNPESVKLANNNIYKELGMFN